MDDIAVQLNNVLTRDGLLGPITPFYIVDGTEALPGLAFSSQHGTGFFRPSASNVGLSINGVQQANFNDGMFRWGPSGIGGISFVEGDATHTGYTEFRSAANVRQGYIGFSTSTAAQDLGSIPYIAGKHVFIGHLGAGVTPSAWGTGGGGQPQGVFQMRGGGLTSYDDNNVGVIQGAYYDGTVYRAVSALSAGGGATLHSQTNGNFTWYTTAGGVAADAAVAMQVRMALGRDGGLHLTGINTSESWNLHFGADAGDNPNIAYQSYNWTTGTARYDFRMGGSDPTDTVMYISTGGDVSINPKNAVTYAQQIYSRAGNGAALARIFASDSNSYAGYLVMNDLQSASNQLEISYSGSAYPSSLITGGVVGEQGAIQVTSNKPLSFGTNSLLRMFITGSGQIALNTTTTLSPTARLTIAFPGGGTEYGIAMRPAANDTNVMFFLNAASSNVGGIYTTSTGTTFQTSCDAALKENIAAADPATALLQSIQVRKFNFIAEPLQPVRLGFVAQELHAVLPEVVTPGRAESPGVNAQAWGVDHGRLTPLLVKVMQEVLARLDLAGI
jgi:hypothetical protein